MKKIISGILATILFCSPIYAAPRATLVDGNGTELGTTDNPLYVRGAGMISGDQPDSVSTSPGYQASLKHVWIGGSGGDTTIATTGIGGEAESLYHFGGMGGRATAAATSSTGGRGGDVWYEGGPGGAATEAGTNVGGAGGDFIALGGPGGAAAGGTGNTNGAGGDVYLRGGFSGSGAAGGDVILGMTPDGRTSGGNIGILTLTPAYSVHESISSNAALEHVITNGSNGASAAADFAVQNDNGSNATVQMKAYGSGFTGALFGITLANYMGILASGSSVNGLIIGVTTADPLIFGTNNAERFRIDSNGGLTWNPGSTLSVVAGTGVVAANLRRTLRVAGSGGAVTVTATPSLADGSDNQEIVIFGTDDTNTVTFRDKDNLASTGLQLAGSVDVTLGKGDVLKLTYNSSDDFWYESYRSNN